MKLGVALLLARLAWRFVRAHPAGGPDGACSRPSARMRAAAAPAARPLAATLGACVPHHLDLYLFQADAEQAASGRWPLFAPWLHTSALPVFAVLAVLVALAWSAVASWLREYERYAEDTCARADRIGRRAEPPRVAHARTTASAPRELFGLAFESRPPPLPA